MKFDIRVFFENLLSKLKFHPNLKGITGTLHEDQYTLLIIYRSFLLRMRTISSRSCRESQNLRFMFKTLFFLSRAVYEKVDIL
jgi:hypothetical protein